MTLSSDAETNAADEIEQVLLKAVTWTIQQLAKSRYGYRAEHALAVQAVAYALSVTRSELRATDSLEHDLLQALLSAIEELQKSPIGYLAGNAMAVQAVAYALSVARGEATQTPIGSIAQRQTLHVSGIGSATLT